MLYSSRLTSNRHVASTITDKSLVISQRTKFYVLWVMTRDLSVIVLATCRLLIKLGVIKFHSQWWNCGFNFLFFILSLDDFCPKIIVIVQFVSVCLFVCVVHKCFIFVMSLYIVTGHAITQSGGFLIYISGYFLSCVII